MNVGVRQPRRNATVSWRAPLAARDRLAAIAEKSGCTPSEALYRMVTLRVEELMRLDADDQTAMEEGDAPAFTRRRVSFGRRST
jgi:hypothetical protein